MQEVAEIIADLVKEGVSPELVGRVAAALVSVTERGPVGLTPLERSASARRQEAYRKRRGISCREWAELRGRVLVRDKYTCHYCGQLANAVDHKIALARGGSSDIENLVAACKPCNSSKRDGDVPKWMERVA
jgi:5-methylcytosine-specific restriction endonuclease McrA